MKNIFKRLSGIKKRKRKYPNSEPFDKTDDQPIEISENFEECGNPDDNRDEPPKCMFCNSWRGGIPCGMCLYPNSDGYPSYIPTNDTMVFRTAEKECPKERISDYYRPEGKENSNKEGY